MTLAELQEACVAVIASHELDRAAYVLEGPRAFLRERAKMVDAIRAIPLPVETAPHVTQAAQRAEQREAWANWFENHAGDATLDTTGVERKTLLWVAKKLRTFPLPSESAPVDDEFAGHTPGPWSADLSGVEAAGSRVCDVLHPSLAQRNADARLIAAAPQLLRERDEARAEVARYKAIRDRAYAGMSWDTLILKLADAERERDEARKAFDMLNRASADATFALMAERDEARAEVLQYKGRATQRDQRREWEALRERLAATERARDAALTDAAKHRAEADRLRADVFEAKECVHRWARAALQCLGRPTAERLARVANAVSSSPTSGCCAQCHRLVRHEGPYICEACDGFHCGNSVAESEALRLGRENSRVSGLIGGETSTKQRKAKRGGA